LSLSPERLLRVNSRHSISKRLGGCRPEAATRTKQDDAQKRNGTKLGDRRLAFMNVYQQRDAAPASAAQP